MKISQQESEEALKGAVKSIRSMVERQNRKIIRTVIKKGLAAHGFPEIGPDIKWVREIIQLQEEVKQANQAIDERLTYLARRLDEWQMQAVLFRLGITNIQAISTAKKREYPGWRDAMLKRFKAIAVKHKNKSALAKEIGVSRRTLYHIMESSHVQKRAICKKLYHWLDTAGRLGKRASGIAHIFPSAEEEKKEAAASIKGAKLVPGVIKAVERDAKHLHKLMGTKSKLPKFGNLDNADFEKVFTSSPDLPGSISNAVAGCDEKAFSGTR